MVTIREYKEFYARKIIVTALQKHVSELKSNCQDTFYFFSLCRRSERQFLVVQMHFLTISALRLLLLLNFICKRTMRKSWTDPSLKEPAVLKDCEWTCYCLSWPTLYMLQICINKRALHDHESQTVEYFCCLHASELHAQQEDYFQTVSLLVAYASYQHLLHLYSHICMTKQRETTVDPRKSKSNVLQVMIKNGAKMLHPSIIHWNSLVKFCRTMCFCKNTQLCYWIPAYLNKYLNMESIRTDQRENS